jgi:hypothetical protein
MIEVSLFPDLFGIAPSLKIVVRPCQAQPREGGRKLSGDGPPGDATKKQRPKNRRSNRLCTVGCQCKAYETRDIS